MSNEEKSRALGINFGTASNRLRKMLLWQYVAMTDDGICFRCGKWIDDVDDLSIEHKEPWQSADDPKAAFFDTANIAFSHLRCNSAEGNRNRPRLPNGESAWRYRNSSHGKTRRRDYNRAWTRKNRV